MTKLVIATPCFGGMAYTNYLTSMEALQREVPSWGIELDILTLYNESDIYRARNTLTHDFLASDADYLMFIDADIGFVPGHIKRMVEANVDIIGGVYPKKEMDYARLGAAVQRGESDPEHYAGKFAVIPPPGGKVRLAGDIYEVPYIATGFLLIHRQVFQALEASCELLHYKNLQMHVMQFETDPERRVTGFWDHGVNADGVYLTEDYWFCEIARAAGLRIHAAAWPYLTHMGAHQYSGCYMCSNGARVHKLKS